MVCGGPHQLIQIILSIILNVLSIVFIEQFYNICSTLFAKKKAPSAYLRLVLNPIFQRSN
nr:MAG TPA: hypothetical protein [Caudoviricetes sp.]